jgi:hypothetical protein
VRSEESLRPEAVRPRPEQGFREFQWRHLDFDEAFGMERDIKPETRPVSPLGHFRENEGENQDEVDYEPGYAERYWMGTMKWMMAVNMKRRT